MTKIKADILLMAMMVFGVKNDEYGKPEIHHCSILNHGQPVSNGRIKYENKDGVQVDNISELESQRYLWIGRLQDISLPNLMHDWIKKNNCYVPIEIDEEIETGEVVTNIFSPVKIMVQRFEDKVKIKLIFE